MGDGASAILGARLQHPLSIFFSSHDNRKRAKSLQARQLQPYHLAVEESRGIVDDAGF